MDLGPPAPEVPGTGVGVTPAPEVSGAGLTGGEGSTTVGLDGGCLGLAPYFSQFGPKSACDPAFGVEVGWLGLEGDWGWDGWATPEVPPSSSAQFVIEEGGKVGMDGVGG